MTGLLLAAIVALLFAVHRLCAFIVDRAIDREAEREQAGS